MKAAGGRVSAKQRVRRTDERPRRHESLERESQRLRAERDALREKNAEQQALLSWILGELQIANYDDAARTLVNSNWTGCA